MYLSRKEVFQIIIILLFYAPPLSLRDFLEQYI